MSGHSIGTPPAKVDRKPRSPIESRIGQRFGRLVVERIEKEYSESARRMLPFAWCKCDCGRTLRRQLYDLARDTSESSCGCIASELSAGYHYRTHGYTIGRKESKEYQTWKGIKRRCYGTAVGLWHRYGGRGIKVCDGWRESYPAFLAGMGPAPTRSHQIDRINNDGNYSCGKCTECVANGWPGKLPVGRQTNPNPEHGGQPLD